MKTLVLLALILSCLLLSDPSFAVTQGCIRGNVKFIQANQGYCPLGRTGCTSDLYLQSDYKKPAGSPMRKVQVKLTRLSTTLGFTYTDDNGDFTMNWASVDGHTAGALSVVSRMHDGPTEVFKIGQWNVSSNDHYTIKTTSAFTITDGTTCSSPQPAPNIMVGTTTTPNDLANIYDAADRMWRWSAALSSSGGELPTVDIEYPADSMECPSGCQLGGTKRIGIPNVSSDAFLGASRTAHEMGHLLAERIYPSNTPNWCGNYNFNSTDGWLLDSREWTCAAWTEAIATFMSDVSRYWDNNAEAADTCTNVELGSCSFMLDENTACSSNEGQWPLSSMRFLWDAYDDRSDGPNAETNHESYESLTSALSLFAAGTGERKRDEWTVTGGGNGTSSQSLDQSGTYDYWWLYSGPLLDPSYNNNCVPPGDR